MMFRARTNHLVLGAALFLAAFANLAFFRNLWPGLADDPRRVLHVAVLGVILLAALTVFIALFSSRRVIRPFLTLVFLASAAAAYFMDTFNVVIDSGMILNAVSTDRSEAGDLLTWELLGYVLLLGVLPSVLIWRTRIERAPFRAALASRLQLIGVAGLAALVVALASGSFVASFVREHKVLRYYANPLTPVYALYRFGREHSRQDRGALAHVGEDAHIPAWDRTRELVIMVVGETARSDHFELNGYARNTNPELAGRGVLSFRQVTSCGTSTAVSVPCMFALHDRAAPGGGEEGPAENVLDVLRHAGVHVLWRDNNSNSKGVADRIPYQDFRTGEHNPLCDRECRDEGMLMDLQDYIDRQRSGDVMVVLHQMGSHGPAYYRRYPGAYRFFTPTCDTDQLDACSADEIVNSYDNSILYTDHFLARVLDLLQANDERFETAMLYVSDHGESLGENGVYLHGLPSWIAPSAQTQVPLILWFGRHYHGTDLDALRQMVDLPFTHDNLFHTVLGMFEIQTSVYDGGADLLQLARLRGAEKPPAPAVARVATERRAVGGSG